MQCYVCEHNPADTTLDVQLTRVISGGVSGRLRQQCSVPVPICSACKKAEMGKRRGSARSALIVMAVLTLAGAAVAGWPGAGLGFGLGFFLGLIIDAVRKPSKAVHHPDVKATVAEGWSVSANFN